MLEPKWILGQVISPPLFVREWKGAPPPPTHGGAVQPYTHILGLGPPNPSTPWTSLIDVHVGCPPSGSRESIAAQATDLERDGR